MHQSLRGAISERHMLNPFRDRMCCELTQRLYHTKLLGMMLNVESRGKAKTDLNVRPFGGSLLKAVGSFLYFLFENTVAFHLTTLIA